MFRSRKYLDAVRTIEHCTVGSPACDNRPGTIEPAHSDQIEDGKGKGCKAHDLMVAAACHSCHLWLGGSETRALRFWYMDRGIKRTIRIMADRGVIKI